MSIVREIVYTRIAPLDLRYLPRTLIFQQYLMQPLNYDTQDLNLQISLITTLLNSILNSPNLHMSCSKNLFGSPLHSNFDYPLIVEKSSIDLVMLDEGTPPLPQLPKGGGKSISFL